MCASPTMARSITTLEAFFHVGRFANEEQRTIDEAMDLLDDLKLADVRR